MTRKRYFVVAGLLAVLVCVGLGVAMLPAPGVTKANFYRIEKGMTKAEVESILGKSVGFSTFKPNDFADGGIFANGGGIYENHFWTRDGYVIFLICYKDNSVYEKTWMDPSETFLDKLRRWLHL